MTEAQIDAYYQLLNDIPENLLKIAIKRCLQESETTFVPAVGTLRRFASEALYGVLPSWGEAWKAVEVTMQRFGQDRQKEAAKFLGEFVWNVANQVGWRAMYNGGLKLEHMIAFRQLYEIAEKREISLRRISEELRPKIGFNANASQVGTAEKTKIQNGGAN